MIEPEDQLPPDDAVSADAEDQQSQQDIHSNGFDNAPAHEDIEADAERLNAAAEASEPSFTLNVDKDAAPGDSD